MMSKYFCIFDEFSNLKILWHHHRHFLWHIRSYTFGCFFRIPASIKMKLDQIFVQLIKTLWTYFNHIVKTHGGHFSRIPFISEADLDFCMVIELLWRNIVLKDYSGIILDYFEF